MARKFVDCRQFPSDTKCTVTISADTEQELLDVAVQHAVAVHGHQDTPEFRKQLKTAINDCAPPGSGQSDRRLDLSDEEDFFL